MIHNLYNYIQLADTKYEVNEMKSEWIQKRKTYYDQLNKDIECNICIVGAGLSGLLCAYQLQNQFRDIVLIESDEICYGASGRNTGKLSSQHGLNYQTILKYHGIEKTTQYYLENQNAISSFKEIIDQYEIDCDFTIKDSIVGCKTKEYIHVIHKEIETYEQCNIPFEIIENDKIRLGLKFKKQASFNPYKFCIQLAEKLNIQIYEHTPMLKIEDGVIYTPKNKIKYQHCILATQVMPFQFKFFYAISKVNASLLASIQPSDQTNEMILIEDGSTFTKNDMDGFMLVGGYDHVIHEDKNFIWDKFKKDIAIELKDYEILNMWSSQDYEVFDGLPIVDQCNDFISITGFNKWGISNSYVASLTVLDILLDKQSKRRDLFSIKRKSILLNSSIIRENYLTIKSLVKSKLTNTNIEIPDQNQATSFLIDNQPIGLYREGEDLYFVNLICPHLKCTLKFNENEKSWDCPCHGSRFSVEGKILKGYAEEHLHFHKFKINELKVDKK